MFQRDYILRLVEALASIAARVRRLLIQQKKPDEAEQVVAEGYSKLTLDREMLLMLDGPSQRTHCGDDDEKLGLAVRLLLLDCEVQLHKLDKRAAQRTLRAARRALQEIGTHTQTPEELSVELERMTQAVAEMNAS